MQGSISQNCVRQSHRIQAARYMLTNTMTSGKWDRLPYTTSTGEKRQRKLNICLYHCLTTACTFSHFYLSLPFAVTTFFLSTLFHSVLLSSFPFSPLVPLFFALTLPCRPYFYGVQICTFFVQNEKKELNSICIKKVGAQVQICFALNNFIAAPFCIKINI